MGVGGGPDLNPGQEDEGRRKDCPGLEEPLCAQDPGTAAVPRGAQELAEDVRCSVNPRGRVTLARFQCPGFSRALTGSEGKEQCNAASPGTC